MVKIVTRTALVLALTLGATVAHASRWYSYEKNLARDYINLYGPDGDFTVYPRSGGPSCGLPGFSYFNDVLGDADSGDVRIQTETCGGNIIVCVYSGGTYCATMSWDRPY